MNCAASSSTPESQRRRPFVCPCGKGYLSYPALFTHVKQKHNGKAPGNLIRPKSQNKRGRPRKLHQGEGTSQGVSERPEFRSLACRLLFASEEEEKDLGFMISQVESAKQRYKANLDFVPPITPSHLALLCPPAQNTPNNNSAPQGNADSARTQLKELLGGARGSGWASVGQIQQLISLNTPYLLAIEQERKPSRSHLGDELYEMDLRTALLQFLEAVKPSLSRGEFRNVELLVSLMIYYLAKEIGEEHAPPTTRSYVQHLNTFLTGFIGPIARMSPYNAVFCMKEDRPARIWVVVHEWIAGEGLSGYVVGMNEGRSCSLEGKSILGQ